MSALDLNAIANWMASAGVDLPPPRSCEKIAGGQSNPTFVLSSGNRRYVLRRKPPGPLLKSAHAVDREYRVQRALQGTAVPTARVYALCEDDDIIGSAFYLMEHVEGRCFDDPRLADVDSRERHMYFRDMAGVLAAIHEVDLSAVGLSDYGPRGNYYRRQIDRWSTQFEASATEVIPAMTALMSRLDANCPEDDGRATLVHGDFRIDNLLYHPDRPEIVAVLDWELSTIGHPFADLAAVIMQWQMPPGDQGRGLRGVDRAGHGLPEDTDFVAWYCEGAGLKSIDNLGFYVGFCFFRMAAILQGVKKRALDGNASDPERGLKLGAFVPLYAEAGLEALA